MKYVISADEYMGTGMEMWSFEGTYRELLEYLNDINDENREEFVPYKRIDSHNDWFTTAEKEFPDSDWKQIVDPQDPNHTNEVFVREGQVVAEWDSMWKSGVFNKPYKDFTNEELEELFNDANGDGQPYKMVFSVDENTKVLG